MKTEPFKNKVWPAAPTMHREEMKYAVALSCCTAALHLCMKSAGERLYGKPTISHGALAGKQVIPV